LCQQELNSGFYSCQNSQYQKRKKEQRIYDFGIKFIMVWLSIWFCSFIDISQMTDSDLNSEVSLSSLLSSIASDGLSFMYTSESNYSSDQTSGNEEGRDSGYVVCEESSDEYDYLLG
jgi:hypothetical protein